MNVAYKHLESKLRLAFDLTIGQWGGIIISVLLGLGWAFYVSPFGGYVTMFTTVYLAGIPAGAVFLLSAANFNVWLHIKALSRHRRSIGRYVPGPGASASGYAIEPDAREELTGRELDDVPEMDLAELWQ
jgi:hypothetical protein